MISILFQSVAITNFISFETARISSTCRLTTWACLLAANAAIWRIIIWMTIG
jgi:hypothetical protein